MCFIFVALGATPSSFALTHQRGNAMEKILPDGIPCHVRVVGVTELQIIVNFDHEPWKTFASILLQEFNKNLGECGFSLENFEDLLDMIHQTPGDIQ